MATLANLPRRSAPRQRQPGTCPQARQIRKSRNSVTINGVRLSWSDVVKPTTRDFVVGRAVSAPSGEPFARSGARSRRMGSSGAPRPRWS